MIGNPLGLIALLAIPAIIGIHLFRRRFRRRSVAGLFLWASPGQDPSSGRRIHRLENNASLWLELLLALCAAIYLLDLRLGESASLPHEIIVLDDSLSMQAKSADGGAASRAREQIDELLREAGPRSQVSIVLAGSRPQVLIGPAAPAPTAREALETWQPRQAQADMPAALELARELAGPDAIVRVLSDLRPPEAMALEPRIDWIAVGRPVWNAALTALRRERGLADDAPDRIFVRIELFDPQGRGARPIEVRVHRGAAAGDPASLLVLRERHDVETEGGLRIELEIPAADAQGDLWISLSDDALPADGRAQLVRPPLRRVKVALLFAEDDPRRAFAARAVAAIPEAELFTPASGDDEPAHLLIGASELMRSADEAFAALPTNRATSFLRVGAALPEVESDGPAKDQTGGAANSDARVAEAPPLLGPFLSESGHPLLEGLSFDRVLWRGAGRLGENWTPLVSAGDWTLIGAEAANAERSFILNVALGRGSLVKSPDWPILVANLVAERRRRLPGSDRSNLRFGESLTLTLPATAKPMPNAEGEQNEAPEAVLIAPSGQRRELPPLSTLRLAGLDELGLWEVRRGEASFHRFAINALDARESDLRRAARDRRDPSSGELAEEESDTLVDPRLHFPLVLIGLFAFFMNWWVLRRPLARRDA
jgi:VWA domain-containing protein/aerotolerance regulator-like protein